MKLIGITGYKQSGKSTYAGYLDNALRNKGFSVKIVAFADALKTEVAMFLTTACKSHDLLSPIPCHSPEFHMTRWWLNDEATKEQFRLLMQWWGTEFRRKMFGEDYWVKRLDEAIYNYNGFVIIPDVRFQNEIKYIESMGGLIISKLGGEQGTHQSEQPLEYRPYSVVPYTKRPEDLMILATEHAFQIVNKLGDDDGCAD